MSDRVPSAKATPDEELVAGWLAPLDIEQMSEALAAAGFSANVYRGCFADLHAQLEDEAAGLLHFLRHGFAEERIFRVELDLSGLDRLRRLPVANRLYLRNVYTALITAWLGVSVRTPAQITAHTTTLKRFCQSGGMPFLVIGDNAARLYRRGDWCGQRWLCPLAMDPIEGGIEALIGLPQEALLPVSGSVSEPLPTLWVFGHADLEWGWLAHRLREGIGPDDTQAADAWAQGRVQAYLSFLSDAVAAADRPMHWLASVLPPVPADPWHPGPAGDAERAALPAPIQAEFGAAAERLMQNERDSLLHRTLMADQFNQALQAAAGAAGFNTLDSFDRLLNGQGVIDERFLASQRDSVLPDQQATRAVLAAGLWGMVAGPRRTADAPSLRDQFDHLLRDIRAVQLG